MAAAFVGKWQIYSSDNFDKYMAAIGVGADMVEKAKTALEANSKLTLEINQNGDVWNIKTTTPFGEKSVDFKLGTEFQTSTLDGRAVKVVNTMEGDKLVEVQNGDGFQSKNMRTVSGNEMVATMCGGGVTAVRKYKRV